MRTDATLSSQGLRRTGRHGPMDARPPSRLRIGRDAGDGTEHLRRRAGTPVVVATTVSVVRQSAPAAATLGAEATAEPRSLRSKAEKICRARRSALSGRKYTSV